MPKLTGKRYSSARAHNAADLLDAVVPNENDCLSFEQRLNELVDLRCSADEISQDAHLLVCEDCQAMLRDYSAMLEATGLLGAMHVDSAGIDEDAPITAGRAASLVSFPADSARSQVFGWSTLLAMLFIVLGGSASVSDMRLVDRVSPVSLVGVEIEQTESAHELTLAGLLEYPSDLASDLVEVNIPLVQNAPDKCRTFFEMPVGGLFAARLPAVDLAAVDMGQIYYIGRCWQHASRLPGIEPWQHSVNFAIGWFNQPASPESNSQRG